MEKRIEMAAAFFLLLTPIILEFSVVLAILGIWNWGLAAVYAVSNVCLALTIFYEYGWCKKLLLWSAMEAMQFLLCAIPLGLRAMF